MSGIKEMLVYHTVFREHNGDGPWLCYECGKPVVKLLVHHLNEDHSDNAPENHRCAVGNWHIGRSSW